MKMDIRRVGDVTVLEPQQERLDAMSVAGFKGQLLDVINRGGLSLVVNLRNVKFLDSSGLTGIVSSLKNLRPEGDMVLCELTPVPANVIRLTRLDNLVKVYPSESQAVEHFAA